MADFGVFAKFARTRLCGHLWTRGLRQNVLRWLHFKRILIKRSPNLRRSVFGAAKFGALFNDFPLVTPLNIQKMADFGVFAKFARTRLCGHLWTRGLRQNVLRWLHFKRILIRRSPDCAGVFLGPPRSAHFLTIFPWSPLWRISENGRFWCLC